MSDTNKKILMCPICGNKVQIQKIEAHTHVLAKFMPDSTEKAFIECTCGLGIIKESVEELLLAWNLRVPMKRIAEQIEELRESCNESSNYAGMEMCDRAIEIVQKAVWNE